MQQKDYHEFSAVRGQICSFARSRMNWSMWVQFLAVATQHFFALFQIALRSTVRHLKKCEKVLRSNYWGLYVYGYARDIFISRKLKENKTNKLSME